ncbi:multicopper oxidase domain-containing protein [Clostridium estertheticum]|uniref:multicopper oxidase domain-containing protein n=1 Tax=Clostridium estertheticum TaxID=238834 RepID=UPI0013EE9309|nr:multicopper oxidase domain-containing protein [Clostridium estertheticum]MBZ9607973.1 multicopper oxidase domain-containing protein [Clostridium estertheticum]
MSIRHYVLLATDGLIDLPLDGELCTKNRKEVYIFGFAGGLLEVDGVKIKGNEYLDYTNPDNWGMLLSKKGTATIPSPMVWGEVDDHIYITLINIGMKYLPTFKDLHTVHLHGAHVATQLDGFPETSFGVPMWEATNPLTPPPQATYFFHPENPGTLMYHCHVEASEHVQMGMYGSLVIYPSMESLARSGITKSKSSGYWRFHCKIQPDIPQTATNRNFAYNNIHSYFDKEYVMLLSDIDSLWHESVRAGIPFNAVNFKPDFWLVNGRAFPDTLLKHPLTPIVGDNPNLTQINYESYVHVKTNEKFLLRMTNMSYQVVPWHIHGWHFMVVGKDSHLSPFLNLSKDYEHLDPGSEEMGFTNTIGSGETYDLILMADDKRALYRRYIVNGQDGFPSLCSQLRKIQKIDPNAIFGIPEEPVDCADPQLINDIEICNQPCGDPNDQFFPQFYPMHNHDDYKATNNGVYPGGQLTFIQADEPDKEIL